MKQGRRVDSAKFLPLLRFTKEVFEHERARLVPELEVRSRDTAGILDETRRIAAHFVTHGGRRFRPFLMLAAYHAMNGGAHASAPAFPDHVKRAAIAIECFHKASLIHDDIEDDDLFRYGAETVHRQHGTPTAINVGDYLVGLGYRILTDDRQAMGAARAADVLHRLMEAHVKLSEGQGAELAWMRSPRAPLTIEDALRIYELKTSPAFEAAFLTGVRLATHATDLDDAITEFSRHMGVAFQIQNGLNDCATDGNKVVSGQDALAVRPTLLLALALEKPGRHQKRLHSIMESGQGGAELIAIYQSLGVFAKARHRIDAARRSAETIASDVPYPTFQALLSHLVDAVLGADAPHDKVRGPAAPRVGITFHPLR